VPTVGAIALLLLKRRSVLDMWLLVALAGWLIQLLLNLPLRARFTAGWYSLHMMMLVSHLVVLLALIAESNRLYARLALSTAARNREREAQRMSMDAVAAAISHEVGQPLAAVSLNASAGLNWLARRQPDVEKAKESLQAISESGQRSFDILKSIRAMFAKEPGWATEFSLNDLIRETVSSLDKELAGAKVSLQLSLDEALPPVLGNRVQLQHVIRNLIVNSIESLAATRGRRRSLTIRSLPEDEKVLLQVSDNGIGIAAEDAWRIFEAFHTTKAAGSGIGLSLCRTIVEEHGGRIWASPGERYGATFHVQLPSGRAPAR
jgi:signal transduction histidine kinase